MHTGTLRHLVLVTLCAVLCACGEDDAPADDREPAPQSALERETPSVTSSRDEADTVAMQEIEIALGPVFLVPTPQPVPTNTTASYDDVEVASFVAPLGTENVALSKPVTSSDPEPMIGWLHFVVDGEIRPYDGYYLELSSGTQSIQIDLQSPAHIHGIVIRRNYMQPVAYRDVVVHIADDAAFTQNVRTVFNNDQDNSSGLGAGSDREYFESRQGKLVRVDGEAARYVRLYSNGNTRDRYNHYVEVEVWGVPVE